MQSDHSFIRVLSPIEQAFTISNEVSPLVVVCALHLSSGPEIGDLENALAQLQSRYTLLQAGIAAVKGRFVFQKMNPIPPISLNIEHRTGTDTWRWVSEQALNTCFDKRGPLMKCWYLPDVGKANCEMIVCFHHAIIDGAAARLILHELLSLCGGLSLPVWPQAAGVHQFPPAFRKWNLVQRLLSFAGRQMKAEWTYRKAGMVSPIPAHSRNATISLRLDPALSRKLSVRIGREGLSLNSVLLAAITQALLKYRHSNTQAGQARAISFADLRPAMLPAVQPQELGCYISMLRLEVPLIDQSPIWAFSGLIRRAIFQASRRGEVFLMSIMSKFLVSMVLRLRNTRLGVSALSFIGKLDLQPQYGPIRLHEVMAFITNNQYGPEFSGFGKILFGSIGIDFTYLTAEIEDKQAVQIVEEIKKILERMAKLT